LGKLINFRLLLIFSGYLLASNAQCQEPKRRVSILPVPIVFYTPETRWAFGAAVTSTFRFKNDSSWAKPSQATIGLAYTQNKQILAYLPFQIFYKNNQYYAYGEVGYFKYNFFYYGIGNQDIKPEVYAVDFPRIKINVLKLIRPRLYAGFRYQYEDYKLTETLANGELSKNTVPGTPRSRTSGVGLGLFYDSRDLVFFPSKGLVADFSLFSNGSLWGGDRRFERLAADVSTYRNFKNGAVWANNFYGSFIFGNAPFNMLTELGGPKKLRGYYQGRYRDHNALLYQTELRFGLYKSLGAVVFGSTAAIGSESDLIRFDDLKYSYGGGLRFTINKRDHINLRLDYAIGQDARNFYVTIGEAF
jgi:outer membrane protein assembly factor BamA